MGVGQDVLPSDDGTSALAGRCCHLAAHGQVKGLQGGQHFIVVRRGRPRLWHAYRSRAAVGAVRRCMKQTLVDAPPTGTVRMSTVIRAIARRPDATTSLLVEAIGTRSRLKTRFIFLNEVARCSHGMPMYFGGKTFASLISFATRTMCFCLHAIAEGAMSLACGTVSAERALVPAKARFARHAPWRSLFELENATGGTSASPCSIRPVWRSRLLEMLTKIVGSHTLSGRELSIHPRTRRSSTS